MTANAPHTTTLVPSFAHTVQRHITTTLGRSPVAVSPHTLLRAVALATRDHLVEGMVRTEARYQQAQAKRVYYVSMEFLLGRALGNNLHNLGLWETCEALLKTFGTEVALLEEHEAEAALGSGGLGRVAACFLDSLASLDMPGYGYGLHYEYGLFKQTIHNGYQQEQPDHWLAGGTPWTLARVEEVCQVPLYGRIEHGQDSAGRYQPRWVECKTVLGVPHDMPIVGYGGQTINVLRLYEAQSADTFEMPIFNASDYIKAVQQNMASSTIAKVLYPAHTVEAGRELRLVQEYFLVACTLRDILRRYQQQHSTLAAFPQQVAIQLNDTHPALSVAELMRLLVDEQALPWDEAWELTQATLGYTNHTLVPEVLGRWPVPLLEYVLPRHLQIIYEINHRFLLQVAARWPGEEDRQRQMSLIEEGDPKQVRMAHLAIVGSHAVNGVSALHSQLVTTTLVPDFAQLWPEKFSNKTNGITQRRWLLKANPLLAQLITATIGDGWIRDLTQLRTLEPYAQDSAFQEAFRAVKRANKVRLAQIIATTTGLVVDPDSLFDLQVKRIHEYKRQLLNVLHIIHTYLRLIEDHDAPLVPRTYVFAGKAAPGYWAAKQIIKLIHNVGQMVNHDPRAAAHMRVVFVPNYCVSLAEQMIPAADVSEQLSTAGTEASGTGNMKCALNGAITVGTLDGATLEMRDEVGAENMALFGLSADDVATMRRDNSYRPWEYCERFPALWRVLETLRSDLFAPQEPGLFQWLYEALLSPEESYVHLADLPAYVETQAAISALFLQPALWSQHAILNVARMGQFSSDRTITEYAQDIWHIARSVP